MQSTLSSIPTVLDIPDATLKQIEWGGMAIETGVVRNSIDPGPFFQGLPDDRCQCPHWGYILKGEVTYRYANRTDVYRAGEVYYAEPGHLPILGDDTEYVEFSPADKLGETMAVVAKNMSAMAGA